MNILYMIWSIEDDEFYKIILKYPNKYSSYPIISPNKSEPKNLQQCFSKELNILFTLTKYELNIN